MRKKGGESLRGGAATERKEGGAFFPRQKNPVFSRVLGRFIEKPKKRDVFRV